MYQINKELLAKCKGVHSAAELASIAKANNMEVSDESAEAYFKLLNKPTGSLSDDELDNVAGGTCYNDGRPVVSACGICDHFNCNRKDIIKGLCDTQCGGAKLCIYCSCNYCKYCIYEKGLWLCTNPNKVK